MVRWGVSICSIQMRLPFCLTERTAFSICGDTPLLAAVSSTQTPEKSSGGFAAAFAFGVRAGRGVDGAGAGVCAAPGAAPTRIAAARASARLIPAPVRARPSSARRRNWPVCEARHVGDVFRGSLRDDPAAAVAALGPEVDDPVGGLDDVEVVLDDDHRVAFLGQSRAGLRAASGCRRSGGRSSARRGGTASGPWTRLASSLASLTRCASPPESVVEDWPSLM